MKKNWRITTFLLMFALSMNSCLKGQREELQVSIYSIEIDAVQSTPYTMEITANCLWTIECPVTWLNISPLKALGDRTIEVHASPNTSLTARQTSFFVIGEKGSRQEVKVMQKGETPTIVIKEPDRTLSAKGEEIAVEVSANVEFDITSDVIWITKTGTKAITNSNYYFKVDQNTSLSGRTGKVTFTQKNGSVKQVLTINQQGEAPDILLSKNSLTFNAEGGMDGVEVTANIPWIATPSKSWVRIVETKAMEKSSCLFSVEVNTRAEQRDAVIIFSREGAVDLNRMLNITQLPAAHVIKCTPEAQLNLTAAGSGTNQKYTITVSANFSWSVDYSKTASWVTDVIFDETTCSFRTSANVDVADRTTQIVFTQVNGTFTKTYTITQRGADPQINILPATISPLPNTGGSDFLFIKANVPWEFSVDQLWLQVERGTISSGGEVTDYLRYTAPKNTNSTTRSAKISLVSERLTRNVTITQEAGVAQLTVSVHTISAPAIETTREIKVTSNVAWTASTSVDWIQLKKAPATKGELGDSVFLATITKNSSLASRQAVINIKQTNGNLREEIEVVQEGAEPAISFNASKTTISGTGDELSIIVSANFPVAYAGVDKNWVRVKTDSIKGYRYNFTIDPTDLTTHRTADITFKNISGALVFTQKYTLVQKGATISVADSLILFDLYRGLSGAVWKDKWILSNPVTTWAGITLSQVISGERRVTEISLPSSYLLGLLEGGFVVSRVALERLTYLQKLDLSGNFGLSGGLPVDLYKLQYLKELNLSNCSFNNVSGRNIPAEWGGITDGNRHFSLLTLLKLNGNMLSGTIPVAVRDHPYWSLYWNPDVNIRPQQGGLFLTVP